MARPCGGGHGSTGWLILTVLSCFILSCECLIGFLLNVNKGPANDKLHRPLHPPSAGAAASSCAQHFHPHVISYTCIEHAHDRWTLMIVGCKRCASAQAFKNKKAVDAIWNRDRLQQTAKHFSETITLTKYELTCHLRPNVFMIYELTCQVNEDLLAI